MTNLRAWLYTQAPDGDSAEAAERELAVYAEQTGMKVVGRSMDIGAEPLVTRIGIGNITQAAENSEFDVLLIHNTEQISDCTLEAERYLQLLSEHGIRTITPTRGVISPNYEV